MMYLNPLLRSIKVLVDLVTVYLFITWTYQGLTFLIESIL